MKSAVLVLAAACIALAACSSADDFDEAKAMMESQITTIWNTGHTAMIAETHAADFVRHNPASINPAIVNGIAEMENYVTGVLKQYAGFKIEIHDILMDGSLAAVRWTVTGTHRQSGSPVSVDGVSVTRMAEGKVVEEWVTWDTQSVLAQIDAHTQGETSQK